MQSLDFVIIVDGHLGRYHLDSDTFKMQEFEKVKKKIFHIKGKISVGISKNWVKGVVPVVFVDSNISRLVLFSCEYI